MHRHSLLAILVSIISGSMISVSRAQEVNKPDLRDQAGADNVRTEEQPDKSKKSRWHYGGFADVGYLLDFNHPANRYGGRLPQKESQ